MVLHLIFQRKEVYVMKKLVAAFMFVLVMLASFAPDVAVEEAKNDFTGIQVCEDLEPMAYPYS